MMHNTFCNYRYVYFLGIGGIGMSALAQWCLQQRLKVYGYDRVDTMSTQQLVQKGVYIHFDEDIQKIPTEIIQNKQEVLIIYTPALSSKHPLLQFFIQHQYYVQKRSVLLGHITKKHYTIAIAGTHGKTTTTAMAAHIYYTAQQSMMAFVGGLMKRYQTNFLCNLSENSSLTDTKLFVEADEFDYSFLQLHPDIAVITALDAEHLDVYGSQACMQNIFRRFIQQLPQEGKCIVHYRVAKQLFGKEIPEKIVQYGLHQGAIYADNIAMHHNGSYFDYISEHTVIRHIYCPMPGYYSIENALAAITVSLYNSLSPEIIRTGLASFQGIQRRFDYVLQQEDRIMIDDYAHHPVEIKALLHTVCKLYPQHYITVIFQPHLYSRTRDFIAEFAQSLSLAQEVFLLDIDASREAPIEGITAQCILDAMSMKQKKLVSQQELYALLSKNNKKLWVVVTIGAGTIGQLVPRIKKCLMQ